MKGYYLSLTREPSVEQIFQAIGQPEGFDEVVFCGYGEPTLRLEVLKVIAARMKAKGAKRVRLNTDGLANLVYGRNIVPELAGLIDSISVSLNAPDAATHAGICPSKYGEEAYQAVMRVRARGEKTYSGGGRLGGRGTGSGSRGLPQQGRRTRRAAEGEGMTMNQDAFQGFPVWNDAFSGLLSAWGPLQRRPDLETRPEVQENMDKIGAVG